MINKNNANFADLDIIDQEFEITENTDVKVLSEEKFFDNEVLRESQKDMKNFLSDRLDDIVSKENQLKVKPRYSRLKKFQSVKSSDGDQVYYVPYSKEQIEIAQKLHKLSQKKNQRPIERNFQTQHAISIVEGEEYELYDEVEEQIPETREEGIQAETEKQTLVPNKLEIIFKKGVEIKQKESNYTPLKAKKINYDLSVVKNSLSTSPFT